MKKRVIDNIVERMIQAGATNESLAEAAGVGPNLINKAKKGLPIRLYEAELIDTALATRTFKRKGKHRHSWQGTKRLTYRRQV